MVVCVQALHHMFFALWEVVTDTVIPKGYLCTLKAYNWNGVLFHLTSFQTERSGWGGPSSVLNEESSDLCGNPATTALSAFKSFDCISSNFASWRLQLLRCGLSVSIILWLGKVVALHPTGLRFQSLRKVGVLLGIEGLWLQTTTSKF